jgi:hypothetical protein
MMKALPTGGAFFMSRGILEEQGRDVSNAWAYIVVLGLE